MNKKEIIKYNGQQFLDDIKRVRSVMVQSKVTYDYYHIKKSEVLENAETMKISYHITDTIFKVRRDVMVID